MHLTLPSNQGRSSLGIAGRPPGLVYDEKVDGRDMGVFTFMIGLFHMRERLRKLS